MAKVRYFNPMEIEARAHVEKPEEIKETLSLHGQYKGSFYEDDLYLRHISDTERSLVLRIRRGENGIAQLTFKGKSKGDDTAWPDVDLPLSEPDALEKLLLENEYVRVVSIKKHRLRYAVDGLEVNLDIVEGLGTFIEIEARGGENERAEIEAMLVKKLVKFGVSDKEIVRKGYVTLMLEKVSV